MGYAKSVARKDFEERIYFLKKTARVASYRTKEIPVDVRNMAYHASIFEASACLEEYIKSLADDLEYSIRGNKKNVEDLPAYTRAYLFSSTTMPLFKKFLHSEEEDRLVSSLMPSSQPFEVMRDGASIGTAISLQKVYEKKKYPSVKNWKALFRRLGINSGFDKLSANLHKDAAALLDSFNDVRTALAHQTPPSLTINDVVRHLDNLRDLIAAADRLLFKHWCKHVGQVCWPS